MIIIFKHYMSVQRKLFMMILKDQVRFQTAPIDERGLPYRQTWQPKNYLFVQPHQTLISFVVLHHLTCSPLSLRWPFNPSMWPWAGHLTFVDLNFLFPVTINWYFLYVRDKAFLPLLFETFYFELQLILFSSLGYMCKYLFCLSIFHCLFHPVCKA